MGHSVSFLVADCKATEGKGLMPCLWEGLKRRHDRSITAGERLSPPTYVLETPEPSTCVFSAMNIKIPCTLGMLHFAIHSPKKDYVDKTLCSPANYLTRTDYPQHICWHWGSFQEFEERLSCETFLKVSYGNTPIEELHQKPWKQVPTGLWRILGFSLKSRNT